MTWMKRWEPEDPQFWRETGSKVAWRTLVITTWALIFSFATWFVMSAVVVRLPQIGFKFNTMQLFWIAAMPGLAGGTLRLIHTFMIPIFGTRLVVSVSTWAKIIPMAWLFFAVQDPTTTFGEFLIIGFLCGFGGGDFSSYMPSTSLFFPKRLQGVSLGIQAGIGNFGVSLTQFITPWIIGFAAFGAISGGPQLFTKVDTFRELEVTKEADLVKDVVIQKPELAGAFMITKVGDVVVDVAVTESDATKGIEVAVTKNEAGAVTDVKVKKVTKKDIWVQNAANWYIPVLFITGIIAFLLLKAVPVKASVAKQFDIMKSKHTWFCTVIYIMTFGSFAGFSAAFPMMIKVVYGGFPGAPDPLKYAFLGPLVGSVIRAIMGAPSDKVGGAVITQVAGLGLILGCIALLFGGYLTPTSLDQFPVFVWIMLWLFLMAGIGNASTFRQFPIAFAFSPRQGAGVVGWTAAWAAYGPFIFSTLIGASITRTGSAKAFFIGVAIFYAFASILNWIYYTKPGAERGDWGTKWGTWWDRLSESEKQGHISRVQ